MAEAAAIDLHRLPPQARRLVRTLGVPTTLRLLSRRGGTRLCVPRSAERSSLLCEIIGHAQVERLIQTFGGGCWLSLPMPDKLMAQMRDAQIRTDHADGHSLMTLATRYELTTRHIQNILRSDPDAQNDSGPQGSLFQTP